MLHYQTADMKMMHNETVALNRNNSRMHAMVEEMRNLPEGVAFVENDWDAGTRTYVFKDGFRMTRRISESTIDRSKVKPSAKPSAGSHMKRSTVSEVQASLKKTMQEADRNISDFIRRIAQLDAEISRSIMRGQYVGDLKNKRDDLHQRINKLEAIKKRCAALLQGA